MLKKDVAQLQAQPKPTSSETWKPVKEIRRIKANYDIGHEEKGKKP
jgi:hypothetical protein